MNRTYISGPISNKDPAIVSNNLQVFHIKAAELREHGLNVVNPAENGLPFGSSWEDHMRVDLCNMLGCNSIYMLPGWTESRGARLEHRVACELGFAVVYGARA